MNYREESDKTQKLRKQYHDGIKNILKQRLEAARRVREEKCADIFENPQAHRSEIRQMLGWPLNEDIKRELPAATAQKLADEDGYSIYRMQIEILDGVHMSGLLFKKGDGKKPLVLAQHGGLGTPELISGIYGDSSNYNDMAERILKHNVNVFAPQLLIWSEEKYGVSYNRVKTDTLLKTTGSSIVAVEIYGLMRVLDYFEAQDYVTDFGMAGLSYGGFYTLYLTALDTRIKSAISCSYFNERDEEYTMNDWCWADYAYKIHDAQLVCLVYPRRICIASGDVDELFPGEGFAAEAKRLDLLCEKVGKDWYETILFSGTHEFYKDDAPITRMVNDLIKYSREC